MYSIKAVSKATGLSVETLRAWERRYAIVAPMRDEAGRRVYCPQDVLRLRKLREGTERGHPISRLATLSDQELNDLLDAPPSAVADKRPNVFVQRMLDAALEFRAAECEQSLTLAIAMLSPQELISDVLQPLLQEVGERWHRGDFAVSQERMISSCVRRHVGLIVETYDRNAHGQPIVFATLPGERHELGLLMAALLCASRGFKVHYLGPDLPPEEIARYARETGSSVVAVSVVLEDLQDGIPQQIATIAAGLGPGASIWIGGSGSVKLRQRKLPECCTVLADPREFERRLELLQAA
jgi:DNA-binding transcriptional MerR regulator/methylmalonyl-CoA mutase cobalamin-binding subunit